MSTTQPPELREPGLDGDAPGDDPPLRRQGADPSPPRRRRWVRWVVAAAAALSFGFASGFALRDAGLQLSTTGPAPNAHLGTAATDDLRFRISADLPSLMTSVSLDYDGTDVRDQAYIGAGVLTYRPQDLSEGRHTLTFAIDQPFVPWRATRSWTFTIDHTRPDIEITGPTRPAVRGAPVTLSGRVNEPATVTVGDTPVPVATDGTFSITFREPPTTAIPVRALDLAGNARGIRTTIPVMPREPMVPTRAVHMTAISWVTDDLREPVLAMLRTGDINTVELDLKDEAGIVGYDSRVPLARRIGAVRPSYALTDAVGQIHALGGRVVGRIVAFRDPVLARWAWDHGQRDRVIQTPSGAPYAGYGGFTNFSDPAVRAYNIDIAEEAARGGVDDILYDYVRRPDGPIRTMVFPGLRGGAEASIVSFLAVARTRLVPTGAFLGASVFGIAASRPEEVAQDVRRIARNVDYVAPMVYPSHWGPGVYGVADPESEPRQITQKSLARFQELVKDSGARLVPWLQDFSLRVHYGSREVCAQVGAARATGIGEWIMWDPNVSYTRAPCLRG